MPKDRFDHLFIAPSDFDRAVAFYRDSLGWRTIAAWGGEAEPRGVVLNGGSIEMVLAERHDADDHSWSHGMNGHRPTMHLTVENLDERFRELSSVAEVVVHLPIYNGKNQVAIEADPQNGLSETNENNNRFEVTVVLKP